MRVIYKYELPLADISSIPMQYGAKVLSVGVQQGALFVWAEADPAAGRVLRTFYIVGTGNPMFHVPDNAKFLGTVQMGPFVWHVYEGKYSE